MSASGGTGGVEGYDVVQVRSADGEDSLSLHFQLKGKEYHLLRPKQEPLSKTLKRMVVTMSKKDKEDKKKKKSRGAAADSPDVVSVEVHVYSSGVEGRREVAPETPNQEAWVSGNTFAVDSASYSIALNTPTVKHLRLPECIMTGCAVVPLVELEFAEVEQCRWVWRQCNSSSQAMAALHPAFPDTSPSVAASLTPQSLPPGCREVISAVPVVSTSLVYWATEEDCHHSLLLECIPRNTSGEGQAVIVASKNSVSSIQNTPTAERHLYTPSHLAEPDQFRVVSYNILANVYASSEHARRILYPYCDGHALDQEYRQCLIAKELLGYHADIVSLQEVGSKCFSQFLQPALHHWGYGGCFHAKAGQTPEGEAIFFNRSKFSLVSEEVVVLRKFVQQSAGCRPLLSLHPLILDNLLKRHNILQTAFLQSNERPDRYLLVANTHLYFHPMGDHIRLLQVEISLKYLESALENFRERVGKDAHVAVMFCGDFNSCPCTAAYNYMLSGKVSKSHPDWQVYRLTEIPRCSCNHRVLNVIHEDDQDYLESQLTVDSVTNHESSFGLDLRHGLHMSNACGTKYATNVTLGWTGVIDYILIDSDCLSTQRVIPMPPAAQLTEHVALPSVNFPSDHVALVADLKWQTGQ